MCRASTCLHIIIYVSHILTCQLPPATVLISRSLSLFLSLTHTHTLSLSPYQALEADLDKASSLLSVYETMKRLVSEGILLLKKAERESKRADMNRCGVWDDVREALENVSYLHDETASLLKSKFILDDKLGSLATLVKQKKELFAVYKGTYVRTFLPPQMPYSSHFIVFLIYYLHALFCHSCHYSVLTYKCAT